MAVEAVDDPTSSSSAGDPPKNSGIAAKSKQRRSGVVARMWRGIFGGGSDDYEKRLSYLSKEEASVHARMKRRASRSRRTARNIIVLSFFVEVIAVAYAIMTTRSLDLEWKMRALRVLPMFALPIISILLYSALTNLTRMCNCPTLKHCIKFPPGSLPLGYDVCRLSIIETDYLWFPLSSCYIEADFFLISSLFLFLLNCGELIEPKKHCLKEIQHYAVCFAVSSS